MDTELQALEQFRHAAPIVLDALRNCPPEPVMPIWIRWAMAGAACVGWALGLLTGMFVGAAIGRRLRW